MKKEDIRTYHDNEYVEACEECGCKVAVLTQPDDNPEYYTEVYLECTKCGEYVRFSLPVN